MQNYFNYIFLALVVGFFVRRWFKFSAIRKRLPDLLKEGAVIVDVRSPSEFQSGHVDGSINIPLQDISNKAGSLDNQKTILLCCASGSRSGMAASILRAKGFKNVVNAGPWSNLQQG